MLSGNDSVSVAWVYIATHFRFSSENDLTPLLFDFIWLQLFSLFVLISFLYESITLKLTMVHDSLFALVRLDSRCTSFVSLSIAWMACSSEFSKVMPYLSIVLVTRASNFVMPNPTCLLLQYQDHLGCS